MPELVIPMPHMGVSVTEGTVVAWRKQAGDQVKADEPICDIATDKVDTEVVAPADGVLARVIAEVGETVEVGEPLAELSVAGGTEVRTTEVPSTEVRSVPGRFEPAAAAEAVVARPDGGGVAASAHLLRGVWRRSTAWTLPG